MQKRSLRFPEIREMSFVYHVVADGEVMTEVELLEALQRSGSKPQRSRATCLKACIRIEQIAVGEIVVSREILLVIQSMIYLDRELIRAVLVNAGNRLECCVTDVSVRHKLVHHVDRSGIHACGGNHI